MLPHRTSGLGAIFLLRRVKMSGCSGILVNLKGLGRRSRKKASSFGISKRSPISRALPLPMVAKAEAMQEFAARWATSEAFALLLYRLGAGGGGLLNLSPLGRGCAMILSSIDRSFP
jgi:hypothetical protein